MNADPELGRLLALVADELDGRGYPYAATVRRAAMLLVGLQPPAGAAGGCRGCGASLTQPSTGRRRVWCAERCRRRFRP